MTTQEPLTHPLDTGQGNEKQGVQQQMGGVVAQAADSGISIETLWTVFEIRLMRALKGGNKK